jgi:anti-sigma-K factor RskA
MTDEAMDQQTNKHLAQTQLLPWFVNGTLGAAERLALEHHLADCAACRADLALEREVHASMTVATPIEYIPAVSLQRLRARLEVQQEERGLRTRNGIIRTSCTWPVAIAVCLAVLALALGVTVIDRRNYEQRTASAPYYTVTSARATVPGEVVRAVFAPKITLIELQTLLDEAQLRIVAGPTEAGVYSLAATTTRPVAESLRALRQHSAVRFAESTQPDARAAGTR